MDRRRAAGTLLALAVCISCSAAAPTANSNQTALDIYDGSSEGCYYNFQYYSEGDRIMTNEPCLNCTCHNRMLMCYLRVCPFTKPIGQDCTVEKRADQCCPIVTCPDVPVDLLTSTSTTSPAEYGNTGLGKVNKYGCEINGKYFPEGAKVQSSPNKPCEHCYCIRNMTTCVMQECTLHVEGCTPIYHKDVCCPVRYSCDHPEDEVPLLDDMTTTVRPTPGFLLTTTTLAPATQSPQECMHDDQIFPDGALIKTEKACEHCYCMKGDIVCVVQECGTPMENEGKNCTSVAPREGQCCPDTYICEGDDHTTEPTLDRTTLSEIEGGTTPSRRVGVEGSGYRNEDETPTSEPEIEGSGDEPIMDITTKTEAPVKETEIIDDGFLITKTPHYSSTSTATEKLDFTSEPDKGLNTVPDVAPHEEYTETPFTNRTPEQEEHKESTESPFTTRTLEEEQTATEQNPLEFTTIPSVEELPITESTIAPEEENTAPESSVTTMKPESDKEITYKTPIETTTINVVENEIEEGVNLRPSQGRIPGEGDCLLNGRTYNNESTVPSTSKCHSSCKCISSIIKCEPILCSPPPEYMNNCQPIYDSPEACCPTYVCDHSKETIPPQPHSQMTETESSTTTPDCNEEECQVKIKQPLECSGAECQVVQKETPQPTEECTGSECKLSETPVSSEKPSECSGDECKIAVNIPTEPVEPSEQLHTSATESSVLVTGECNGNNCGEVVTEKELSTTMKSPEATESLDSEQSAATTSESPEKIPQKESTVTEPTDTKLQQPVTTESSDVKETTDKTPTDISPSDCNGNECKVVNIEVPTKSSTESSEASDVLKEEPTSTESTTITELPSKCSREDCKVIDKEPTLTSELPSVPTKPVIEEAIVTETALPHEEECNGDDCKQVLPTRPEDTISDSPVTSKSTEDKLSGTTESVVSAEISPIDCVGNQCKVIDKDTTDITESSEITTLSDNIPVTEPTIQSEIPPSECDGDNCKETPIVTQTSEATELSNQKPSTERTIPPEVPIDECIGDDCKAVEKETPIATETSEAAEIPSQEPSTERTVSSEVPSNECIGDDCEVVDKEIPIATETSIAAERPSPEPSTERAASSEVPSNECIGGDCNVVDKEIPIATETSAAAEMPSPEPSTERTASTEVPSNKCIGDDCKLVDKETSITTETSAAEVMPSKEPSTERTVLTEVPINECIGDNCRATEKEPSHTTESSGLSKTSVKEPSDVTESALPTAECNGEDCTIIKNEDSAATDLGTFGKEPTTGSPVIEKEQTISTEPALISESSALDCHGQDCKNIKEEPSAITVPTGSGEGSISSESTEPPVPMQTIGEASPTVTESVQAESTLAIECDGEKCKQPSSATASSMTPENEPSPVTDKPAVDEIPDKHTEFGDDKFAPTESAETVSLSENEPSPTAELPTSSEREKESTKPSEMPEKESTSSGTEEIQTTKSPDASQSTETPEKESFATTENSVQSEETEKVIPFVTEPSVSVDLLDNQSTVSVLTPEKETPTASEPSTSSETTKSIEMEPTSVTKSPLLTESTEFIEPLNKLTEPTAESPAVTDSVATVGTTEKTEKQEPTSTEITQIKEKEPPVSTESAISASQCIGNECKITEKEPSTTTGSPLSSEPESNIVGESKVSESSTTTEPQPDIVASGECNGGDCRVIEIEPHLTTESALLTDQPKTEPSLVSESTEEPVQECTGDTCKSDEKEVSPITELPMSERPFSECSGEICNEKKPSDQGLEITCKGDDCKSSEKVPDTTEPTVSEPPAESEGCAGVDCAIPAVPAATSEPSVQSTTQSENECVGDQCKTVEKNIPSSSESSASSDTNVPTESTLSSASTSLVDEPSVTKLPPKDEIEAECGGDSCRRRQTTQEGGDTTSSKPDIIEDQKVDKDITKTGEVTTEIMPQDTTSVPGTENKEQTVNEKQPESTTQPQIRDIESSTQPPEVFEVSPTERISDGSDNQTSTGSVLKEQTTQSNSVEQKPEQPMETSTMLPEPDTAEKQSPITESDVSLPPFTNAPVTSNQGFEPITEQTTESVKVSSAVTEKLEIPVTETEIPLTETEQHATTIAPELVEKDNKEKPEYQTEATITEIPVEKTTLNAYDITPEIGTEEVPHKISSESIAETETEVPSVTEVQSVPTLTSVTETEPKVTVQPEIEPTAQTTVSSIAESEPPTSKSKPEQQTQVPELIDITTISNEEKEQTLSPASEELLTHKQQETTISDINLMITNVPEHVTNTPEAIATESQIRVTESAQQTEKESAEMPTMSDKTPQSEAYETTTTIPLDNNPQSISTTTESHKQTPTDAEESGATTVGLRESSTEETPEKQDEPVTSRQPDLVTEPVTVSVQDISSEATTLLSAEKNKSKPEESVTQSSEIDQTTVLKVAESPETTPYQVELELHTHKTPEETSSPADFEASTAFVLTVPSKEPEYPLPQEEEQTSPDIKKTTLKVDIEDQTEKMPSSNELLPTSIEPIQNESKETEAPIIQTTSVYDISENDNRFGSPETNGNVTEIPAVQQTEKQVEPEATIPPSIFDEAVSPVTEKITTEKLEEMPILTTSQPEKLDEKPQETLTTKPIEMPEETSEEDGQLPSGPGYGQEPDYVEEDQAFGPGTCRYGGKVYVSAQQIPRDDPCDFCFCFRSDIICLQQSCPPPIHGCREEPIQGFCCPRYECPVSMATSLNVTTTTTSTTTTLPPHFLPHAYKGAAQRKGCVIKGHTYKVGEVVRASSGPCLHCTCGGDGQMKCDPKVCTPEPMLRQMIAAAVSSKRRR